MSGLKTEHESKLAAQTFRDRAAWQAVLDNDLVKLNEALVAGANPNARHPASGHRLLEQACRSEVKGSAMAAMLIERGAALPTIDDPLAFELSWRAIIDDSVLLARFLVDPAASKDPDQDQTFGGRNALKDYFLGEKAKFACASTTSLDCMLKALAAKAAVSELIENYPAPLILMDSQSRQARAPGMR